MNLELEAFEGELQLLRRDQDLYLATMRDRAHRFPTNDEEVNMLRGALGEAQARIHEMALRSATLEARIDAVANIAWPHATRPMKPTSPPSKRERPPAR